MSQRVFVVASILLAVGVVVFAQTSPYVGFEARPIKALSPEQVTGYQSGEGMGFAMAAELNGYPGPKHVLELASELELSPEQRDHVQAIFDKMHTEAVRLGESYVDLERRLDELFSSGAVESETLRTLLAELGDLRSRLRFVHLDAHIATKRVLSGAQAERYGKLRGYDATGDSSGHSHHSGHHHSAM